MRCLTWTTPSACNYAVYYVTSLDTVTGVKRPPVQKKLFMLAGWMPLTGFPERAGSSRRLFRGAADAGPCLPDHHGELNRPWQSKTQGQSQLAFWSRTGAEPQVASLGYLLDPGLVVELQWWLKRKWTPNGGAAERWTQ